VFYKAVPTQCVTIRLHFPRFIVCKMFILPWLYVTLLHFSLYHNVSLIYIYEQRYCLHAQFV
jgi:hypothetical protein